MNAIATRKRVRKGMALTARGRVVGSPGYMSPEQIRGDALTPASDLYSLGLVFYEMISGERAIDSEDLRFFSVDYQIAIVGEEIEPRLRDFDPIGNRRFDDNILSDEGSRRRPGR